MKKIIRGIIATILFITSGFVLDRLGFVLVMNHQPESTQAIYLSKIEYIDRKPDADVLILGSSGALSGIDPNVIADQTSLSAFNITLLTTGPYQWKALLRIIQIKPFHQPKYVILETSPNRLKHNADTDWNSTRILVFDRPWYLYECFSQNVDYFRAENLSALCLVKNDVLKQIGGFFRNQPPYDVSEKSGGYKNGYRYYYASNIATEDVTSKINCEIDEQIVVALHEVLTTLVEQGIKAFVVEMPFWETSITRLELNPDYDHYLRIVQDECEEFGLQRINGDKYALMDILTESDFLDASHLNSNGAQKFTNYLVEEIVW